VLINLVIACDLGPGAKTDDIHDTLDYRELNQRISVLVETSQYYLIESLAEAIAVLCLEDPRVQEVTVGVDKPGALRNARSVAVEITRASSK